MVIPIFTAQLEKAREATDAANIRAAYSEVVADALNASTKDSTAITKEVELKQQKDDWQNEPDFTGELKTAIEAGGSTNKPTKNGKCTITYTPNTQVWTVTYSN